jgi:hypothetical protein
MLRVILFVCAAVMWAQQAKDPEGLAFEVVSVKASGDNIVTPGHPRLLYDFRYSGQRVTCDQQIEAMLEYAYSVRDFQIVGPEWLGSLTYAVDAIMLAGSTKDDARLMIRRMLADRFGLDALRKRVPTGPPLRHGDAERGRATGPEDRSSQDAL